MYRDALPYLSGRRANRSHKKDGRMTFRAIAVVPENAPVFLRELDLTIDYKSIEKDYLVHGFPPPIEYAFYTKEEFDREWRFLLGQERNGQFSLVLAKEGSSHG